MASAVIVVYALLMRFLMLWPDSFLVKEILRDMGALVPITLVMTDVIKNDGGTIIVAAICFYWFLMLNLQKKK
ncbi:hypothetical protein [Neptunomonas concharum]|uniref:YggT family protein n=1 Tax=Neptunomonas concharum TaxID=1031538 RepID=A0A5P1RE04_9GAMM|nr:hypothetical protein [Neptunomonas concharum]QEQ97858.1 hypothetical protein F0U83_14660 [Neptunomonas concharum]